MIIYYQSQSRIHKIHNNHGDYYELVQKNLQGKQNNIILLATYNDYNAIYRSTECTFLLLSFLFFQKPTCFTGHENSPNKCAKINRRNNPPEKSAMATCWIHTRLKPAEFTFRKDAPFQLAVCLPEIPPSLLKIPREDPARHPSPPPPQLRQRSRGEGAGSRPGAPTHLEQVLLLSFPFSWMVTYPYMTRHIHILHRADWYESITILL